MVEILSMILWLSAGLTGWFLMVNKAGKATPLDVAFLPFYLLCAPLMLLVAVGFYFEHVVLWKKK